MKRLATAGYDVVLLLCVLALLGLGILMVYSASGARALDARDDPQYYLVLQSAWAGLGLLAMAIAARIDYHRLRPLALPLLALAIVLLIAVLVPEFAQRGGGASRWLRIGSFLSMQPAEFAKLALVLYLAAWFSVRRADLVRGRLLLQFTAIVAGLAGLVVLEPDLGTAVVIVSIGLVMYFAAGARVVEFVLLGTLAVSATAALAVAAPYRLARILAFLDPWSDTAGIGYQTVQALYALALGGPFGEGLGVGREKFGFLPAPYTDSIFAVLADELGLVGAVAVIALFAAVVLQGLRIARRAPDDFGALLATGIISWLGFQAWINMAVIASLVPMTGIPLPFISYGGSSLVVSLASVGILLNVGRQAYTSGRIAGDSDLARGRRDRRPYEPPARGRGRSAHAGGGALRLRGRSARPRG
jgi:cell division protein FtsW